ncbi:MAG: efflux RND transporter periplasmic adaptor subunit [Pseudomonadota bacterium]
MNRIVILFFLMLAGCARSADTRVESTGTIEATQVDIRSEVAGRILNLPVDEGRRVHPGDTLAEIDHEKPDYELQNAQGKVRELEARLALLQHGFRQEEVQKAQEALLEAEIQLKDAERENMRIQKLFKEKVASDQMRDTAETASRSAMKRYEQAKQSYGIYKEGARAEDIAAAQAAKESAEAAAGLIARKIRDATIKSPAQGIISEKYVEAGELVASGSILFSIIDLKDIWIMAYISEINLGRIKVGQPGSVAIDSFPGKKFPGKVVYISPEAEFTPKNIQTKEERVKLVYAVKVQIDNAEELLKPGMPADVVIEVN